MVKHLRVHVFPDENLGRTLVKMAGPINDTADLSGIGLFATHKIEVDLGEVTWINSTGIRAFRNWIIGVTNPELHLSYCPKCIIDQINMVKGFLPDHAKVASFYVPYFGADENSEKTVLYREGFEYRREGASLVLVHPEVKGPDGTLLELDVPSAKYFAFLQTHA